MDLDYIKQHDVSRRYLQGQLCASDTALFEEFILDKPELITQLELDIILRANLSKNTHKAQQTATKLTINPKIHDVWKLGLAAAFGAIMVLPFVQHQSVDELVALHLEGQNHIAYLESSRSLNTDIKRIVVAANTQQLILMIQPATLDENDFTVQLKQSGLAYATTYKTESQLSNSGDLIITLPVALLAQGIYELNLSGLTSNFSQTFSFEIALANP